MFDIFSPGTIIALLICGGLMLLFVTRWASLRRRSVWERFARRYKFAYGDAGQPLTVQGQIDGRPFSLRVTQASSDTGLLGIEEVMMTLGLRGRLPEEFEVTQGDRLLSEAHQALDSQDIQTGDEAFDQQALVKGKVAADVIEYLSPRRKAALGSLLSLSDCWNAGVAAGAAFVQDRNLAEEPRRLDRRLRLLREVAPLLDGDAALRAPTRDHG